MINTLWSAAGSAFSSIMLGRYASGKPGFSVVKALNGAITVSLPNKKHANTLCYSELTHYCSQGMAAICASANSVRPWSAFIIGLVAGAVYRLLSRLISHLKIDDPIDAIPGR